MNRIYQMRQLRKKGLSYESVGELFNISRQRVHQLISGYITPHERNDAPLKYKWLTQLYISISERDNWACQKCGSKAELLIHHIDKDWSNMNPTNLVCLCGKCHLCLHRPKENPNFHKAALTSWIGKHHTEEAKEKIRKVAKLRIKKRNKLGQFT